MRQGRRIELRAWGLWVSILATLAPGCAEEQAPLSPPDLADLVDAYEHPTGRLDAVAANELFDDARATLDTLAALAGFDFALSSLTATNRSLAENGLRMAVTLDIDGRAAVTVTCPGDGGDGDPDPERDGTLLLQVPIEDAGLGPVAFGPASACRFGHLPGQALLPFEAADTYRGLIDGDVAIHLGKVLRLGDPTPPTALVRIDGWLEIEGVAALDHFDFRLSPRGRTETRVVLDGDQEIILFLEADAVGLREARGAWRCSRDATSPCAEAF